MSDDRFAYSLVREPNESERALLALILTSDTFEALLNTHDYKAVEQAIDALDGIILADSAMNKLLTWRRDRMFRHMADYVVQCGKDDSL